MNIENVEKVKVAIQKRFVLKACSILDFHSEYYILEIENWIFVCHIFTYWEKIIVQVNSMTCLRVDTISLTAYAHVIMQKYDRYLLNTFTNNTSLVVSTFLWRELRLITLTN